MESQLPSGTLPMSILPLNDYPGADTFGAVSEFLRGDLADEDSRRLSERMADMAQQAEAIVTVLRSSQRSDEAAPLLMDLLTLLREHHGFVAQLGPAWRGLYEHAAYLQGLNNFRVLIGQWLQATAAGDALAVTSEEFERIAWRTLGEGVLLVDMYEQWPRHEERGPAAAREQAPKEAERELQWWQKLRR